MAYKYVYQFQLYCRNCKPTKIYRIKFTDEEFADGGLYHDGYVMSYINSLRCPKCKGKLIGSGGPVHPEVY